MASTASSSSTDAGCTESPIELPLDLLQLVLAAVPQTDRLHSCSLVQTSWAQAATAATTAVQLLVNSEEPNHQQRVDGLLSWLEHRGQHITRLELQLQPRSCVNNLSAPQLQLPMLPCPRLRELRLERCQVRLLGPSSDPTGKQQQVPGLLQSCTALTSLSLSHCGLVQPTRQLSLPAGVVSGLRRLHLSHVHAAGLLPCSTFSGSSVHVADTLLQQLSSLTALQLRSQTITTTSADDDEDDTQQLGPAQLQALKLEHVSLQDANGQHQGVCDCELVKLHPHEPWTATHPVVAATDLPGQQQQCRPEASCPPSLIAVS